MQARIIAIGRQQLLVRTTLDDAALVHDQNQVGFLDGRQPVSDHQRGAAFHDLVERRLDMPFRFGIERRGGFVEDQQRCVLQQRAGNRQTLALTDTLGQAKVQAMRERIAQIHPTCVVHGVEEFVDAGNWPQLLPAPVHAVIDACDQVAAKVAMAAWALRERIQFIAVGAAGGKRHAERVEIADIAEVTHDPLIAQLRYRLRRHHGAATSGKRIGVAAVFSRENVVLPEVCENGEAADGSLNCHGYGSSVAVTGTFGLCAAGWVSNQLARNVEKTAL